MNRETLLNRLRKNGNTFFVLGIVLGVFSFLMTLVFISGGLIVPLLIFLVFLALSVWGIIIGLDYKKGESSKYVKKRPGILELADSFSNTVYENDFIIVSDKAVVDKKNYLNIVALDDVLAVYESIMRTNGIVSSHTITLCPINGRDLGINVLAKKREVTDDLLLTIAHFCPNAKVGYSGETLEYVEAKRKEYKEKNGKA